MWSPSFGTADIQFGSRNEAKKWIIKNQFGRRNLSIYQRSDLALELEKLCKETSKQRQGKRTDLTSSPNEEEVNRGGTDERLAKIAGVGKATIHRARKVREEAPIELLEKVKSGERTLNSAYNEIKSKPQESLAP